MRVNEAALAEQKLNRLSKIAIFHQLAWLLIFALLLFLKPYHYQEIGRYLGLIALLSSFLASRIYIQAGKTVEEFKEFSKEEVSERIRKI